MAADSLFSDAKNDIYFMDINDGKIQRLTNTSDTSVKIVSVRGSKILYGEWNFDGKKQYLNIYDILTGVTGKANGLPEQFTDAYFFDNLLVIRDSGDVFGIYYNQ